MQILRSTRSTSKLLKTVWKNSRFLSLKLLISRTLLGNGHCGTSNYCRPSSSISLTRNFTGLSILQTIRRRLKTMSGCLTKCKLMRWKAWFWRLSRGHSVLYWTTSYGLFTKTNSQCISRSSTSVSYRVRANDTRSSTFSSISNDWHGLRLLTSLSTNLKATMSQLCKRCCCRQQRSRKRSLCWTTKCHICDMIKSWTKLSDWLGQVAVASLSSWTLSHRRLKHRRYWYQCLWRHISPWKRLEQKSN